LCLANLGNSNAFDGINGNSKLLDAGDILDHHKISTDLHHLVPQHLGTALKEIEFLAAIGISKVHRLTGMEDRKNAMGFGWCLSGGDEQDSCQQQN